MRRLVVLLLAVASVIVPVTAVSASSTSQPTRGPDGIGIRLVALPGDSGGSPLATSYVVERLAPGTSVRRTVAIDNSTDAIADVAVYTAGASIVRGNFAFNPSHSQNELSRWTSVSRNVLRLAPGTEALDTMTIRVPKDAESATHYAVVWAEVSTSAPTAGGVRLVNRVGVRIYLSVGLGGAPSSNLTVSSLTAQRAASGAALVVATVRNTGHSTLDVSGTLTLSQGPGGLAAGPFPVKVGTVLPPGESEPVTVLLSSALPRGPWRADLRLASGITERSVVATITFPLGAAAKSPTAAGFPTLMVAVILLLLLLALAALALLISRRKVISVEGVPLARHHL